MERIIEKPQAPKVERIETVGSYGEIVSAPTSDGEAAWSEYLSRERRYRVKMAELAVENSSVAAD